MKRATHPEIVFGLVGAVGAPLDAVQAQLVNSLRRFGYLGEEGDVVCRLSSLLDEFSAGFWKDVWATTGIPSDHEPRWWSHANPPDLPPQAGAKEHIRRKAYMDAGDRARAAYKEALAAEFPELTDESGDDVLAQLAVAWIADKRAEINERLKLSEDTPLQKCAFVLRSLKNPQEVYSLQRLYGPGFFLIGVFASDESRGRYTEGKVFSGDLGLEAGKKIARYLMGRDFYGSPHGQNVRDTFCMADVFVAGDAPQQVDRFLDLLFGKATSTPTRDEYAMYLAHASAATSGAVARQVGAAVVRPKGDAPGGDIVALGRNEVPHPRGGLISAEDSEWLYLRDINSEKRRETSFDTRLELVRDIYEKLSDQEPYLAKGVTFEDFSQRLRKSKVMDIIEFHPEVHAEAAALMEAAKRGIPVEGCSLFTTTYPCHDCAKHIMAAGIRKVVYIEPYPKSKARDFYNDGFGTERGVLTLPFVGIGPRRYRDLFSMVNSEGGTVRRSSKETGAIEPWSPATGEFRWRTWALPYSDSEQSVLDRVAVLRDKGFMREVAAPGKGGE